MFNVNRQAKENTISEVIDNYLKNLALKRSKNTIRAYQNAMTAFSSTLANNGICTKTSKINKLPEDAIAWFADDMKTSSPATERLYLTAVIGFYEYLVAEHLADLNLPQIRSLFRQYARRPIQHNPKISIGNIEEVINHIENIAETTIKDEVDLLRKHRDRAFLLTLADTGIRVHEACGLKRGDIDVTSIGTMVRPS